MGLVYESECGVGGNSPTQPTEYKGPHFFHFCLVLFCPLNTIGFNSFLYHPRPAFSCSWPWLYLSGLQCTWCWLDKVILISYIPYLTSCLLLQLLPKSLLTSEFVTPGWQPGFSSDKFFLTNSGSRIWGLSPGRGQCPLNCLFSDNVEIKCC